MGFWDSLTSPIKKLIDATDPTRDVKLAAFGTVIVASVVWLTREQARGPITNEWVDALKYLLAAVAIGGPLWAAADKWKQPTPPSGDGETK